MPLTTLIIFSIPSRFKWVRDSTVLDVSVRAHRFSKFIGNLYLVFLRPITANFLILESFLAFFFIRARMPIVSQAITVNEIEKILFLIDSGKDWFRTCSGLNFIYLSPAAV